MCHYNGVIITTMASHITGLTVVYSNVYSGPDQRKHQSSASLAFVWGIHRDRWIPRTKGQLRGKCFHLMTSSCDVAVCKLPSQTKLVFMPTNTLPVIIENTARFADRGLPQRGVSRIIRMSQGAMSKVLCHIRETNSLTQGIRRLWL